MVLRGEVAQLISTPLARIGARNGRGRGASCRVGDPLKFGPGDTVEVEGTVRPWHVRGVEIYLNENANWSCTTSSTTGLILSPSPTTASPSSPSVCGRCRGERVRHPIAPRPQRRSGLIRPERGNITIRCRRF